MIGRIRRVDRDFRACQIVGVAGVEAEDTVDVDRPFDATGAGIPLPGAEQPSLSDEECDRSAGICSVLRNM